MSIYGLAQYSLLNGELYAILPLTVRGGVHMSGSREIVVVPGNQLALKLFEDFPGGIVDADQDVGYHKPKTLIQVSSLSLLSRRAINACYFLISDSTEQDMHIASLAYFKWLIGFDSRNSGYLKKSLEEAQRALVQVSVADERNPEREAWLSVALLGKVAIANGKIAFSVDNSVRKLLRDPGQLSYLSLRILAAFTSQYALELYEKLLGYQEAGYTPWLTVDLFDKDWVKLKGDQREYKYVNRDILSPAIAQINELSNLHVELETRKAPGSRKIGEFRFKVSDNPNGKMVVGAGDRLKLKELYQLLTDEFGLSDIQIEGIADTSPEKIWSAVEYTRSRIAAGLKIGIPAKYLLSALDGGWTVPKTKSPQALLTSSETPEGRAAKEKADLEKRKAALDQSVKSVGKSAAVVDEFLLAAKIDGNAGLAQESWSDFLRSSAGKLLAKKKTIGEDYRAELQDTRVRTSFAGYLEGKRAKHA